jgi:hypothetical protein
VSANLKLVVDNSARSDGPVRPPLPAAIEAPPANRAAAELPWTHRFWAPRSGRGGAVPTSRRERPRLSLCDERGAVTAEYAVVIMAAVAFAGLLVAIIRSGEIRQMLVDLVQNALGAAG